ncbi:MAG: leucine-rich repeat domain-containing protein, partial [Limibaculum sp.]
LAGMTALQTLLLGDTQVADIAPLAGLTALQTLDLADTQVTDIAPLAGLTALQRLDLDDTQVADIAPLAGMTALQGLDLQDTQVADIAPLAGLENLRDLYFSNIPACAADPKLAELSEIGDIKERTRRTLAYLRGEEPKPEPDGAEPVIKSAIGYAGASKRRAKTSTPEQVRTLQQFLAGVGFDPGPDDGIFGDKTQQAMQAALAQGDVEDREYLWRCLCSVLVKLRAFAAMPRFGRWVRLRDLR